MQIRPANRASGHLHQYLARAGFGLGHLLQLKGLTWLL
jgi:hypothetical protein